MANKRAAIRLIKPYDKKEFIAIEKAQKQFETIKLRAEYRDLNRVFLIYSISFVNVAVGRYLIRRFIFLQSHEEYSRSSTNL